MQAIITELVFEHALRIRMKAETSGDAVAGGVCVYAYACSTYHDHDHYDCERPGFSAFPHLDLHALAPAFILHAQHYALRVPTSIHIRPHAPI